MNKRETATVSCSMCALVLELTHRLLYAALHTVLQCSLGFKIDPGGNRTCARVCVDGRVLARSCLCLCPLRTFAALRVLRPRCACCYPACAALSGLPSCSFGCPLPTSPAAACMRARMPARA